MKTYIKYIIATIKGLIKDTYYRGEYVVSFADDECILLDGNIENNTQYNRIPYKQIWNSKGNKMYDDFNGGSFVRLKPWGKKKFPKYYNTYRLATKREIKKLK